MGKQLAGFIMWARTWVLNPPPPPPPEADATFAVLDTGARLLLLKLLVGLATVLRAPELLLLLPRLLCLLAFLSSCCRHLLMRRC